MSLVPDGNLVIISTKGDCSKNLSHVIETWLIKLGSKVI